MKSSLYTEETFAPYVKGKEVWPHFEERPLERVVNVLACGGGLSVSGVERIRLSATTHYSNWARYFFFHTQAGEKTGEAYVLIYGNGGKGRAAFVQICKHEKVLAPGANEQRGWSPGNCRHCGLDMTVDSGD